MRNARFILVQVVICLLMQTAVFADGTVIVSRRPLADAAILLSTKTDLTVTYEDGPLDNALELEQGPSRDTSMIPKPGKITIPDCPELSASDLVSTVVAEYNRQARGETYTWSHVNDICNLIPAGHSQEWPQRSPLSTTITLSMTQATCYEVIAAMAEQIRLATPRYKIALAGLADNNLRMTKCSIKVQSAPAREVLNQLLKCLKDAGHNYTFMANCMPIMETAESKFWFLSFAGVSKAVPPKRR